MCLCLRSPSCHPLSHQPNRFRPRALMSFLSLHTPLSPSAHVSTVLERPSPPVRLAAEDIHASPSIHPRLRFVLHQLRLLRPHRCPRVMTSSPKQCSLLRPRLPLDFAGRRAYRRQPLDHIPVVFDSIKLRFGVAPFPCVTDNGRQARA